MNFLRGFVLFSQASFLCASFVGFVPPSGESCDKSCEDEFFQNIPKFDTFVGQAIASDKLALPSAPSNSALAKQTAMWQNVLQRPYTPSNVPIKPPSTAEFANLARTSFTSQAFLHQGDEMIQGRKKMIHPYGAVAKVKLDISASSPFSGLFRSGGVGLARLSWVNFNNNSISVSMALKIFIDGGAASQNFHFLKTTQGTDKNFFTNPISNIFPPAVPKPNDSSIDLAVRAAFEGARAVLPGGTGDRPEGITILGLYEQASIFSNGTVAKNVVEPYRVVLTAPQSLKARYVDSRDRSKDFRTVLNTIPENTVLYDIVAYKTKELTGGVSIGKVVTTSALVASQYGDERLYFKHASKRSRG